METERKAREDGD